MKAIRITTWAASALFAASLAFAQDTNSQAGSARDGAGDSATAAQGDLLCKQKRSGGGKAKSPGKQKRSGARDGSGVCQDDALAARGAGKGKGRGNGDGQGQGKQKRVRDGSGDGCQDDALAARGAGNGQGKQKRGGARDGSGNGQGQGKQKRARDGSGDGCQDGALVQCGCRQRLRKRQGQARR